LKAADLSPRFLLPSLSTLLGSRAREKEIRSVTGLSAAQWRDLGRAFPRLGADPGPAAARARRKYGFLVGRALEGLLPPPAFRENEPDPQPRLYATAHVGDLRSLRLLLRNHTPVATVVDASEEGRAALARADRAFDPSRPHALRDVFSSSHPHRLRSALRRASLIVAADMPERAGIAFPCLGGSILLDARPFRLARLAGALCQPIFLTSPQGRLTISIGRILPSDEGAALAEFARALEDITEETPLLIDGVTWWNRLAAR
jgi:hypothetical protein